MNRTLSSGIAIGMCLAACGSDVRVGHGDSASGDTSAPDDSASADAVADRADDGDGDALAPDDDDLADVASDDVASDDVADATAPDVTAVCGDCDDHLSCTVDGCGSDGVCRHELLTGFCAIDQKCVEAGHGSSCQVCVPDVDPHHYTGLTGGPCDDKDPCTDGEQCQGGLCRGGVAKVCAAPDVCHESTGCDPDSGECGSEPLPDDRVCGAGKVCEAATCIDGDGLPTGMVAWFDAAACPAGWVLDQDLVGRSAVAVAPERVGQSAGSPLASGEDRTHGHAFSGQGTAAATSFAGIVGGGNALAASGAVTVSGTAEPASAGIPYVQLLPCAKVSEAVYGGPAPDLFGFVATGACPDGWPAAVTGYDRLLVGAPLGGSVEASFGGSSADAAPHHHALTATLPTPAHGIALASGCCGGGFASSAGIALDLVSDDASVVFPWRGLLQCQSPAVTAASPPDTTPPGLVAWARGATCPVGWSPFDGARGRVVVGAGLGGDVGLTVGLALADREDRSHSHAVDVSATLTQRNVAAADGPNNSGAAPGTLASTLTSGPSTSGLRFLQRLACKKD
ncbi:MAG: hypothetical protein U1F43_36435 [Myxococcota bacterium]